MTRDQIRAQHAYARAGNVSETQAPEYQTKYKIAVNDLGANIMRSGLAAAVAFLQRRNDNAAKQFIDDLGKAGIPGLVDTNHYTFPERVRSLDLEAYMLATHETLKVAQWFKRAVQATFREQE
jgi:CRISPR-associated protein Cmr5